MTTQVSQLFDAREFESMLFHYSVTQDNVLDTSKFTSAAEAWNNFHVNPYILGCYAHDYFFR